MKQTDQQIHPLLFLIIHIVLGIFIYRCFMALFFTTLTLPFTAQESTPQQARNILWGLIGCCTGGGLFLTWGKFRWVWSILVNIFTPYVLFILLDRLPPLLRNGDFFSLPISFALIILYELFTHIKAARRTPNSGFLHLLHFFQASHLIIGSILCQIALFVCFLYSGTLSPTIDPDSNSVPSAPAAVKLLPPTQYRQELRGLSAEYWNTLPPDEKLSLLRQVIDIETTYLGLEQAPDLYAQSMPPETNGHYRPREDRIVISQDRLEQSSGAECVRTILHECFHAFQYRLCALYEQTDEELRSLLYLRRTAQYMYEFNHYQNDTSSYSSYLAYWNQACETDARAYSDSRITAYDSLF